MSGLIHNSVFRPLSATLTLGASPFTFQPTVVEVQRLSLRAGAEIGTAMVRYGGNYAENATPAIGQRASISVGGTMIFRGAVVDAPFEIAEDADHFELVLSCDKWLMQVATIGQALMGSQTGGGFLDVGSEVIFNKNGRPNKDPSALDFRFGDGAEFWSIKQMLELIFTYYIASTVAALPSPLTLPAEFDATPSHVNLVGQTALQAVDTLCELAACSWGLTPATAASVWTLVKPGAGTVKTVSLFRPRAGAGVSSATTLHATACRVEHSMVHSYDRCQAISGRMVVDTTYGTTGSSPLLVKHGNFKDKTFVARYGVDVTAYQAKGLGQNLSSGAKPKKWLSNLVTRMKEDGSAYLSASDIEADPKLRHAPAVNGPIVWFDFDAEIDNARLVTGGYRVDIENCLIDFEPIIQLATTEKGDIAAEVEDWSAVGIWVTAATVIERVEYVQKTIPNPWFPLAHYLVLRKEDLVPEKRLNVYLPDLADTGDRNAVALYANGSELEAYVDVGDQLTELAENALAASDELERRCELRFPCFPLFTLGDLLVIQGRSLGLSGNEVVTEIEYNVSEAYETIVRACNVVAGMKAIRDGNA